jgi:hypothetical protein
MTTSIPPWATHIAVDANGEVWAFEEEPVWVEDGVRYGHWEPVDGFDGLRFEMIGGEIESPFLLITDAARLLCVRVPRPDGWQPPEDD